MRRKWDAIQEERANEVLTRRLQKEEQALRLKQTFCEEKKRSFEAQKSRMLEAKQKVMKLREENVSDVRIKSVGIGKERDCEEGDGEGAASGTDQDVQAAHKRGEGGVDCPDQDEQSGRRHRLQQSVHRGRDASHPDDLPQQKERQSDHGRTDR